MRAEVLRELWQDSHQTIACHMADGAIGILIAGPTDTTVHDWRFGFQVHGEDHIRWLKAESVERNENGLLFRESARPEG